METRYFCSMRSKIAILFLFLPLIVPGASLRMEGDRAWLHAEGTPLPKVLALFERCGVEVMIDPLIEFDRISGHWENAKIERVILQLASPHSYLLEWEQVEGPLGRFYQVSSIRIFSAGNESAVERLGEGRKVLDIVEGKDGTKYIRGEIMIAFAEGATEKDLNALLEKLGGTVIEVINPPGIYRIKISDNLSVEEAMEIASGFDKVKGAEPNLAFSGAGNPAVPISGTRSGMNLNLVPGETAIAVFDSGLDPKYFNLPYIRGVYNAFDPDADMTDPSGHGTLVALIASGALVPLGADDSQEIGAPVLAVRVFDENGMTSSDILMRAIDYAIDSDIQVINLSFGTYEDIGFLEYAVQYAAEQGIAIFVAAGNDGLDVAVNPAASSSTRSVGATDENGEVADYSNTKADDFLPGSIIYDGKRHQGTSFASPWGSYLYATGNTD
jgi:hypothetical protein